MLFVILEMFGWWPLLAGFAGGFVLTFVGPPLARRSALVLWALAPPALFVLEAAATGCLWGGSAEECMFGWGLILLPLPSLLWLAAVVGGSVVNRLMRIP